MEKMTLTLKNREVTGKAVKQLRREGMVPAVIHDHGKDSIVVMGPYLKMSKAYSEAGKHHPVTIKTDSKQYTALIKNVTFDPKKNTISHIVFNAVKANQKVDAAIPVRIRLAEDDEQTPAEQAGLVVLHQLDEVEVEAFPRDLPQELFVDGTKLVEAGDSLTVADIDVPENVTVKTEETHPVATAFEPSALQAANDDAGESEGAEAKEDQEGAEGESSEGGTESKDGEAKADSSDKPDASKDDKKE